MKLSIVSRFVAIFVIGSGLCQGAFAQSSAESPDTSTEQGVSTKHLAGLIIHVSDFERSIDFYTRVMGLKTVGRVQKDGKLAEILLSTSGKFLNGMMLTLQPKEEGSGANPAGFGEILFMTPSNKELTERLRVAGFKVNDKDPQHLFTEDPDGYRLMIYEMDQRVLDAMK